MLDSSPWMFYKLMHVLYTLSLTDIKLEQNQVAGFLTLLRNLVQCSELNQETLLRENALALLGALLQKVSESLT